MPGPFGHNDPNILGAGTLFKLGIDFPKLKLYNNIFLFDHYATSQSDVRSASHSVEAYSFQSDKLIDCRNNVIVWSGPGEFPGCGRQLQQPLE